MSEGLNDKILTRMLDLNSKAISRIQRDLKGTKPFASKPIPPEDLIYAKNTLGYMDMQDLVREYGQEKVNTLFYDISLMENRRRKSGTIKGQRPPVSFPGVSSPVEGFRQETTPASGAFPI